MLSGLRAAAARPRQSRAGSSRSRFIIALPDTRATEHGVVRAVVSGLRRQLGVAQQQKTGLEIDPLRAVLAGATVSRCETSRGPWPGDYALGPRRIIIVL
jgi:hypothetical protein